MNTKTPKISNDIIKKINNIDLKSERLNLRKFAKPDVEFNIQHEMNPEIMRFIRDISPIEETRKKTEKYAEQWMGNEEEWTLFALRFLNTDEYIGMVCFRYESIENDTVEMGWRLGLEHHGKGYATEAANTFLAFLKTEIKPHKVNAYCVNENIASSNIMKKLGMEQEACLRQFGKLGGKWFDEAIYGLILN